MATDIIVNYLIQQKVWRLNNVTDNFEGKIGLIM